MIIATLFWKGFKMALSRAQGQHEDPSLTGSLPVSTAQLSHSLNNKAHYSSQQNGGSCLPEFQGNWACLMCLWGHASGTDTRPNCPSGLCTAGRYKGDFTKWQRVFVSCDTWDKSSLLTHICSKVSTVCGAFPGCLTYNSTSHPWFIFPSICQFSLLGLFPSTECKLHEGAGFFVLFCFCFCFCFIPAPWRIPRT